MTVKIAAGLTLPGQSAKSSEKRLPFERPLKTKNYLGKMMIRLAATTAYAEKE